VPADLHRREQKIIDFCRSSAFSVEKLSEIVKTTKSEAGNGAQEIAEKAGAGHNDSKPL
jgi:hypothetical protein